MDKYNHTQTKARFDPKELIPACPASSVPVGKYDEPMFQKIAPEQYAHSSRLNYAKRQLPELSAAAEGCMSLCTRALARSTRHREESA
ncbi:hypothetical protein [Pseudomonas savastanoi]|uniref:hypothetical protein n=1 Tax=Pseudomonas savastanoi TaxID=29438 RepID=UPI00030C9848|nr:hypothetical protein [Pseudomonas savastanoi]